MGQYKNKAYTLRIDENLMDKVKILAEQQSRTVNKQIEHIIRQYLDQYEKEQGRINPGVSISRIG